MSVPEDVLSAFGGPPLPALIGADEAVAAVRDALLGGLDPAAALPRTQVPVGAGELLLMPAEHGGYTGVKITGVAPGNPARGLPRITGVYLLLDAETLRPVRAFDGPELTLLRTAAVSALAVDVLAPPGAGRLLVHGTGPQARAHAQAIARVRPLRHVGVAGTRPEGVAGLVAGLRAAGLPAAPAEPDAVRHADVVACCTTARTPLFDGRDLDPRATVVAIGSHTPDARELDGHTMTRGTVVVEDPATALREAGDIVIPVAEGLLDPARLVGLADVVRGRATVDGTRPRVYKSVGMGWQDLAVAVRAHRAAGGA
jgi:ornithine cyclodeaminase/alanine dehydrogenase-like protein (mu-crystallin family)